MLILFFKRGSCYLFGVLVWFSATFVHLLSHFALVWSFVYRRMNKFLFPIPDIKSKCSWNECSIFCSWNSKYPLCWVMQNRLRRRLARVQWICELFITTLIHDYTVLYFTFSHKLSKDLRELRPYLHYASDLCRFHTYAAIYGIVHNVLMLSFICFVSILFSSGASGLVYLSNAWKFYLTVVWLFAI